MNEWVNGWVGGFLFACFSSDVFDVMSIICRFLLDGMGGWMDLAGEESGLRRLDGWLEGLVIRWKEGGGKGMICKVV